MQHRIFTAAATSLTLLAGAFGSTALAEDTIMSGSEVERLLSGNTAEGVWDGAPYKSYFGTDGTTIYVSQNNEQQVGKWRIDPESGQYQSFWDAIGWTEYTVLHTDAGFAWLRNGKIYPFTMIEGRNLE